MALYTLNSVLGKCLITPIQALNNRTSVVHNSNLSLPSPLAPSGFIEKKSKIIGLKNREELAKPRSQRPLSISINLNLNWEIIALYYHYNKHKISA